MLDFLSIPVMTINFLSKCSALLGLFLFWFFKYWNQTVLHTHDHGDDDDDDGDDDDDDDNDGCGGDAGGDGGNNGDLW